MAELDNNMRFDVALYFIDDKPKMLQHWVCHTVTARPFVDDLGADGDDDITFWPFRKAKRKGMDRWRAGRPKRPKKATDAGGPAPLEDGPEPCPEDPPASDHAELIDAVVALEKEAEHDGFVLPDPHGGHSGSDGRGGEGGGEVDSDEFLDGLFSESSGVDGAPTDLFGEGSGDDGRPPRGPWGKSHIRLGPSSGSRGGAVVEVFVVVVVVVVAVVVVAVAVAVAVAVVRRRRRRRR
eukprot:7159084-Pyramimonas_sp.AAC.1